MLQHMFLTHITDCWNNEECNNYRKFIFIICILYKLTIFPKKYKGCVVMNAIYQMAKKSIINPFIFYFSQFLYEINKICTQHGIQIFSWSCCQVENHVTYSKDQNRALFKKSWCRLTFPKENKLYIHILCL